MAGYRSNEDGYGPTPKPPLRLSMPSALAISLAIGALLIAILYFKGAN